MLTPGCVRGHSDRCGIPHHVLGISLLILFLARCDMVVGDVTVYPRPGPSVEQSGLYQVSVIQDGVRYESFTYQIRAQKTESWRHNVCSFTTFSFSGSVVVEVKKLDGATIQFCRVYPSSYAITPEIVSSNTVRTTLREPMKKMAVIFDNDWTTHPLLVFADAPETDVPNAGDAKVIYFGPGVHNAGMIRPAAGQTVYLAGGAYVKGAIDARNQPNVMIRGRGVLSQEDMAFPAAHAIDLGGWDLVVEYVDVNASFSGVPGKTSANTESFETGDFSSFDWRFRGDSAWVIRSGQMHSGARSACAGSISDGGTAELSVSLDCQDREISFYRRVSSEPGFDGLAFYIDGVKQGEGSGEQEWAQVSYPVAAGRRTFVWTYSKDGSASEGSDTAWIDDIVFPID
ncbi:MAG: hypothetical protein A2Y77_15185 [Planctomycetes bacterium RBG_13_62_9]|nr:MAG: hypothetical protein A2Y77_15185 [Planctomycetes bacterium RBG_13_62_9]